MNIDKCIEAAGVTLLEVYAPWCPHCRRMMPVVAALKKKYEGKAAVVQCDGDAHPEVDDRLHVSSYPTWIVYKDGAEVYRATGEMPQSELEAIINKYL